MAKIHGLWINKVKGVTVHDHSRLDFPWKDDPEPIEIVFDNGASAYLTREVANNLRRQLKQYQHPLPTNERT